VPGVNAPTAPLTWAERLKRVFDIDISVCPLCGGTVRVIADVTEPDVIQTILAHLKQRAPPGAMRRKTPFKGAQNDLFAASEWFDTSGGCFSLRQHLTAFRSRPSVRQRYVTSAHMAPHSPDC